MAQTDFVEFYCRPKKGIGSALIYLRLKRPVVLFDETPRSDYRKTLATASRKAKRELGLHPCSQVICTPHDWSDGVDALSEQTINALVSA